MTVASVENESGTVRDLVFVVYGRDKNALAELNGILADSGLDVMNWEQAIAATGRPAPHAREVLEAAMRRVKAVVVLFTGDQESRLFRRFCSADEIDTEGALRPQARQNVVFEAGLATALFPRSTILVKIGRLTLPSDIDGVQYVALDFTPASRAVLLNRLKIAGCRIRPAAISNISASSPPPDEGLPPLEPPSARSTVRIALMRHLRSMLPVPRLGGSVEVTNAASIGENLILSLKVEPGTEVSQVHHWPPGAVAPELILFKNLPGASLLEIPVKIARPAGMHYFDIVGKSPAGAEGKVLARTECVVSED